MKKIFLFLVKLLKEFHENELIYMANELTYKMLIAIFPLLIYIINIFAIFGIKYDVFLIDNASTLPDSIAIMLQNFLDSVEPYTELDNLWSIMNFTLFAALFSSSSGFYSIIRGINKTYEVKDERSFFVQRGLSVVLVLVFTFTLVTTGLLIVFSDVIMQTFEQFGIHIKSLEVIHYLKYFISAILILVNIMIMYKVASYKKITLKSTFPGALVTVVTWVLASVIFNIYINNFSKYNVLYGAIGSVLIFILWLNILAIVLLVGSQVNAILYKPPTEETQI